MPIINIKTLKLDQEKKDLMAERIYENAKKILEIPTIDIFFNEFNSFYSSGKLITDRNEVITVTIEGPIIEPEKRAELCKVINEVIHTTMGDPNFKVNVFTYHGNEEDHAGINGKLFSELFNTNQ